MQCDRTTLRGTTENATFLNASRKVSVFRVLPLGASSMTTRHRSPTLPREVILLTTYAQLDLYLAKFSLEELGLVLLLGRHGTGKSESLHFPTKSESRVGWEGCGQVSKSRRIACHAVFGKSRAFPLIGPFTPPDRWART